MIGTIVAIAVGIGVLFGHWKARQYTRNRLRFVEVVQNPLAPLIAGVATALTGLVAIERAQAAIDWWMGQGSGLLRLTGVALLALGGFVAYACTPSRRPRAA